MRLLAVGGDARMQGAIDAAKKAGWESSWIQDGQIEDAQVCDVLMLPWPHSFRDGRLVTAPPRRGAAKEAVLTALPPCRVALYGSGAAPEELTNTGEAFIPQTDELFLRRNAQLTAEGAICRAMQKTEHALLTSTCLITGYGRIGQELTARLVAMGAFVIVCARSEMQMRAAHALGAHPVPLGQLGSAAFTADVIFNTVPARVMGEDVLAMIGGDTHVMEQASAPYCVDVAAAKKLGVHVEVEGGIPGRYAPLDAGEALFDAAQRALKRQQEGMGHE